MGLRSKMKIIITGGRDFRDKEMMFKTLDRIHKKTPIEKLGHGDATGADSLAREWGLNNSVTVVGYPAAWSIGKNSGETRNLYMFKDFSPDYILAFPGGQGTKDSINFAKKMGYKVVYAKKTPTKKIKDFARDLTVD